MHPKVYRRKLTREKKNYKKRSESHTDLKLFQRQQDRMIYTQRAIIQVTVTGKWFSVVPPRFTPLSSL